MKIIFAKNIGFCSGVKRAIEIAESALKNDPKPVHFLGPLVHNEKVIENLEKKGGEIVSSLKKIRTGTLILRAHGEILDFKKIRKEVLIRDATCPLVKNAQFGARNLSKKGYRVIIIGDKNHPEVKGINKSIKNRGIVVEKESEAKRLPRFKKIGVVCQTTQDKNKVNRIIKILKNKTKKLKWLNTICPEVISRQKELSQIIKKVDGILVIGSHSSANTKRLVEIVKKAKKPVWWINSFQYLKKGDFKGLSTLGVVSGTSTPDWEIKKKKKWLKEKKQK